MKYGFIERHDQEFSVQRMCEVLAVSRSGYYEWRNQSGNAKYDRDQALLEHIRLVHQQTREAYGAKKTWLTLNDQGIACGKHRVARLRKLAGIEARRKRRFRLVVESHATAPPAPNLLQQRFAADAPNQAWVGDMTFIRTRAGFLYLAVLLDLFGRRVVGWSMSDKPNVALVLGALDMAIEQRRPAAGLIHHSDQGAVYGAGDYRQTLLRHGMLASMSAKGNAYDNAVAESFFGNLKNELVHHRDFASREAARSAIFDYIEVFYNRTRIHQTLGYVSPMQFEQEHGVT